MQIKSPGRRHRHTRAERLAEFDHFAGADELRRGEHRRWLHMVGRSPLVAGAPLRGAACGLGGGRPGLGPSDRRHQHQDGGARTACGYDSLHRLLHAHAWLRGGERSPVRVRVGLRADRRLRPNRLPRDRPKLPWHTEADRTCVPGRRPGSVCYQGARNGRRQMSCVPPCPQRPSRGPTLPHPARHVQACTGLRAAWHPEPVTQLAAPG